MNTIMYMSIWFRSADNFRVHVRRMNHGVSIYRPTKASCERLSRIVNRVDKARTEITIRPDHINIFIDY